MIRVNQLTRLCCPVSWLSLRLWYASVCLSVCLSQLLVTWLSITQLCCYLGDWKPWSEWACVIQLAPLIFPVQLLSNCIMSVQDKTFNNILYWIQLSLRRTSDSVWVIWPCITFHSMYHSIKIGFSVILVIDWLTVSIIGVKVAIVLLYCLNLWCIAAYWKLRKKVFRPAERNWHGFIAKVSSTFVVMFGCVVFCLKILQYSIHVVVVFIAGRCWWT